MANRFPLVINNNSALVGELIEGDSINLQLSGIYDGSTTGSFGQVLTSTGFAGVQWARAADVFVDDSQTLINKSFGSSTFDGTTNTFLNIPNSALVSSSIEINGNTISLGGTVNTPNDNDNTTYGISFQDTDITTQKVLRLTAGGTGTGVQDNFLQTDTDSNNRLTITRIGSDTLEFSALVQDLTLGTHLSYDAGTVYNGSTAREIQTDATSSNDPATIVSRNINGDFSAGQITANLTGNVTGNVTGSAGSVEQSLTLGTFLSFTSGTSYDGSIAREIQVNASSLNSTSNLVSRNSAGNFSGNTINANTFNGDLTGDVTGNADTATTADKVEFTLTRGLYLTGNNYNGSAATTWAVDGTASATANKVVVRDNNGSFSAFGVTVDTLFGNNGNKGDIVVSNNGQTWTIDNGAVTTSKIANDQVTYAKMQNVVTANRLLGSTTAGGIITETTVQTAMIANGAVNASKLVNDAVTAAKLRDSTTTDSDRAVTTNHIRNQAVTTAKIANEAVTAGKLSGSQNGSAPVYGLRAFCVMTNGSNNNPNVQGGRNIQNITRNGSNVYTVNFSTNMPNNNYAVMLTIGSEQDHVCQVQNRSNGSFEFRCTDAGQDNGNQVSTQTVHIMVAAG